MSTKKPKIKGIKFLQVVLSFDTPIDRNLYDLGSVHLDCEGRTFILDVCQSYTNENRTEIMCELEVDTDTFPVGEESEYDLTAVDLVVNKTTGTLYIGDEYEETPDSVTLFIKSGGLTKAIELTLE